MRPEPVWCERRNCSRGFVYGPAAGESAAIVRRVRHSEQAHPDHTVCGCAKCGTLYEIEVTRAVAA